MVDAERVRERLGRLDRLLALLDEARAVGEDRYLGDLDLRLRTERALQLALQVCIDLGAHVVSERGLDPPQDYRAVFGRLRDAGLLDPDLAGRLGEAAGLRNLLVHGYADLDDRLVWRSLGRLDDLRRFAAAIARLAER